jgi:hypothetical protein
VGHLKETAFCRVQTSGRQTSARNLKKTTEYFFTMGRRYPIYRSTCDDFIPNNISPEDGAAKILAVLQRA